MAKRAKIKRQAINALQIGMMILLVSCASCKQDISQSANPTMADVLPEPAPNTAILVVDGKVINQAKINWVWNDTIMFCPAGEDSRKLKLNRVTRIKIAGMSDLNKAEALLSAGDFQGAIAAYGKISNAMGLKKNIIASRSELASQLDNQLRKILDTTEPQMLEMISVSILKASKTPTTMPATADIKSETQSTAELPAVPPTPNIDAILQQISSRLIPLELLRFLCNERRQAVNLKCAKLAELLTKSFSGQHVGLCIYPWQQKITKIEGVGHKIDGVSENGIALSQLIDEPIAMELLEMQKTGKTSPRWLCGTVKSFDIKIDDWPRWEITFKTFAKLEKTFPEGDISQLKQLQIAPPANPNNDGSTSAIVYLVDHSEAAKKIFTPLKQELIRSVTSLRGTQIFTIILLGDNPPIAFNGGTLLQASKENKLQACDFLEKILVGKNFDFAPALELGVATAEKAADRCKIIYLLASSEALEKNEKIMEIVEKIKGNRHPFINTFLYGPITEKAEKLAKEIANQTGGRYKNVELE